jgi:hypothetical protein
MCQKVWQNSGSPKCISSIINDRKLNLKAKDKKCPHPIEASEEMPKGTDLNKIRLSQPLFGTGTRSFLCGATKKN